MSGNKERNRSMLCECGQKRTVYKVYDKNNSMIGWINSIEFLGKEEFGRVNPRGRNSADAIHVRNLLAAAKVFECQDCNISFTDESEKGKIVMQYGVAYLNELRGETTVVR